MEQEKNQNEYGEIYVMDYIRPILKRRGLIFGITLAAIIIAAVFSFFQFRQYKVDTLLSVGTINDRPIKNLDQLIVEINSNIYGAQIANDFGAGSLAKIKVTNPKNTNLIIIETKSSNPSLTKSVLDKLAILIINDLNKEIAEARNNLKLNIKIYEDNVANLERAKKVAEAEQKNLENIEKALEQSSPYQDINQGLKGSLFTLFDARGKVNQKAAEIGNLSSEINSQKLQANALQEQLNNAKEAMILKSPIASRQFGIYNLISNTVVAVILGVFVGVLLALMGAWVAKAKQ